MLVEDPVAASAVPVAAPAAVPVAEIPATAPESESLPLVGLYAAAVAVAGVPDGPSKYQTVVDPNNGLVIDPPKFENTVAVPFGCVADFQNESGSLGNPYWLEQLTPLSVPVQLANLLNGIVHCA